jgi:hypothetical protein
LIFACCTIEQIFLILGAETWVKLRPLETLTILQATAAWQLVLVLIIHRGRFFAITCSQQLTTLSAFWPLHFISLDETEASALPPKKDMLRIATAPNAAAPVNMLRWLILVMVFSLGLRSCLIVAPTMISGA